MKQLIDSTISMRCYLVLTESVKKDEVKEKCRSIDLLHMGLVQVYLKRTGCERSIIISIGCMNVLDF